MAVGRGTYYHKKGHFFEKTLILFNLQENSLILQNVLKNQEIYKFMVKTVSMFQNIGYYAFEDEITARKGSQVNHSSPLPLLTSLAHV